MIPTRRGGFTILEILIAVVVVSVGLIGVLALLGQSLRKSGKVVEEGYAMSLARSVQSGLRDGARERAFMVDNSGTPVKGFIWLHAGLGTTAPAPLPTSPSDTSSLTALYKDDHAVFLPRKPTTGTGDPIFVYPRPNGSTDPTSENQGYNDDWNGTDLKVTRVFKVPAPAGLDTRVPADNSVQYGFAIAIQRAKTPSILSNGDSGAPIDFANPSNGTIDTTKFPPSMPTTFDYQDGLYSIEVMIYRNFEPDVKHPLHKPLYRYRGLLALGP